MIDNKIKTKKNQGAGVNSHDQLQNKKENLGAGINSHDGKKNSNKKKSRCWCK